MEDAGVAARIRQLYEPVQADVMLTIEQCSCGSDYGAISWTTRAEADRVARLLNLAPGIRLLEIGAGTGWPGLYLVRISGCDVVLTDVLVSGLQIAARRAASDKMQETCWTVTADATALPFGDNLFDAVSHSDVLCCLADKIGVLRTCRSAIRSEGRMVFSVISVAPGLSGADRESAVANGPSYIASEVPYDVLLEQAGWRMIDCFDITEDFVDTVRRVVNAHEAHEEELCDLFGEAEAAARMTRVKARLATREAGLHRRELYVAVPAS